MYSRKDFGSGKNKMLFESIAVGVMAPSIVEISSTENSEQLKTRTATKINSFDTFRGGGKFHKFLFEFSQINLEKVFRSQNFLLI